MRRKKNEKTKIKRILQQYLLLLSWFLQRRYLRVVELLIPVHPEGTAESSLSGKLTLNGSTSMATVCQALGEVFHEQNPGVTVEKAEPVPVMLPKLYLPELL